jgi:putative phage-type endonuclease
LTVDTWLAITDLYTTQQEALLHHPSLDPLEVDHFHPDQFVRSHSIGGTDISIICGVNPYTDQVTLFKRKLGLIPKQEMNDAMEWGLRHEAAVLKKYQDDHPDARVISSNPDSPHGHEYPGVMVGRNPQWSFCHASPDGFSFEDGVLKLLEVKTSGIFNKKKWGPSGSSMYPLEYKYQIMWYLNLLDLREADLIVLIGLRDYRTYTIKRNEKLCGSQLKRARDFYEKLNKNIEPKEQPVPIEIEPDGDGKVFLKPTPELSENVQQLIGVKQKVKELKAEESLLSKKVKKAIGAADGVAAMTWEATISRFPKDKTNWESVEAEGGIDLEVKSKHTTTSVQERLNVRSK